MTATHDQPTCTSEPRPTNTIARLWAYGAGRDPGCAIRAPWWSNTLTAGAAGILTLLLARLTLDVPATLTATATATLAWMFTTGRLDPTNWHGTCEMCGLCSAGQGVLPARTKRGNAKNLTQAGWVISTDGRLEHCPAHAPYGFYRH